MWSKEEEDKDKEQLKDPEINTMEQFTEMASGILSCLQFTFDTPASNTNAQMPVLDTSMWVDWQTRELGIPEEIIPSDIKLPVKSGQLKKVVMYRFYRKTIANKTPFNSRSAGPLKDKIQQVSQEFVRRFRNTSRQLPVDHIHEVNTDFLMF